MRVPLGRSNLRECVREPQNAALASGPQLEEQHGAQFRDDRHVVFERIELSQLVPLRPHLLASSCFLPAWLVHRYRH